jgi:predicted transcriptional regulator
MQSLIKRNRLQVLTEILDICKSPQVKTRLMQKANLSYSSLQDCLQQLQNLNLVQLQNGTSGYVTTEKGITFLIKWKQLQEILNPHERVSIKARKDL